MAKSIYFVEKDAELVKKIQEYQEKNCMDTFISAVRELCEIALSLETTIRKLK